MQPDDRGTEMASVFAQHVAQNPMIAGYPPRSTNSSTTLIQRLNRCTSPVSSVARTRSIGVPDVHHRLESDPPAMALDVGCGYGWSSVALAAAYPNVRVVGVDLDEPSIEAAIRHARESGVDERVSFHVAEAASPDLQGRFNAVFVFEALHDMAQPVARRHQSRTHRHGHRHRHARARR